MLMARPGYSVASSWKSTVRLTPICAVKPCRICDISPMTPRYSPVPPVTARITGKVGYDPITDAGLAKHFTKTERITGRRIQKVIIRKEKEPVAPPGEE